VGAFKKASKATALTLAVLLATASCCFGQATTATLTGIVADAAGLVVPKANITLTNELSSDVRKTQTNNEGYYSVVALPAATYSLAVEVPGFQKFSQKGIVLSSAEKRNIDVTLQVGLTTQTVEVGATVENITPIDSGEKAEVLNTQTLQGIATVGRSAAEHIKMLPGFAQTGNGVTNAPGYDGQVMGINGNGNAGRQSALGYFAANGAPLASIEIMSDGAHVSDPGCNCATPVNPNPDMIQEVKLLLSNFSAENSKGPIVISTITKAGGAGFHGEGYLSARNYVMNANDWLNNRNGLGKAQNVYYFPGGNIGGPLIIPGTKFNKNRDKLFFFAGFEYFYQHLTSAQIQTSVPTAAMRNGDFSPASIAALGLAGQVPGNPQPVNSPQFPGGIIPASQFDKGGQVMTGLLPMPNANPSQTGGYNYVLQVAFPQNGWQFVTRADYSISDATKLFVRVYHQQELQNFPIQLWGQASNQVPYPSAILGRNHSESEAVDLTHVFSPTLTNEFVGSFTFINFPNSYENPDAVNRFKLGYPYHGIFANGIQQIPNLSGSNNQVATLSNNSGLAAGHNMPSGTYSATKPMASLADNLAKVWGTHTFKAGFYAEYYANLEPAGRASNGTITVDASSPSSTGNAYADLLTGRVFGFLQGNFDALTRVASYLYEGYLQDSWKVTRRFTVDYGIRLQHDTQWFDRFGIGMAVWNPATYTNSSTAVLPGIAWHGIDSNIPIGGFPNRGLFKAPRFGMAWDLFGNGKTVIRGGVGLFRYRGPQQTTGVSTANGSYQQSLTTCSGTTLAAIDASPPPPRSTYQTNQALVARDDSQMPLTWTYNFTISQHIPGNSQFEAAYVGNKARHLAEANFQNINAVSYGTMLSVPDANSVNYNLFRPYTNYGDVTVLRYDGFSDYNALQIALNHQSARYTWLVNYTYSKVLGQGTAGTTIDQLNPANNYGPLNFDRRNIFNAAYSLKLGDPIKARGYRILGGAVNGWSVSGLLQVETGASLQLNSGGSRFNLTLPRGVTALNITGTSSVPAMPVLTCNPLGNLGPNQYLNPSCFALPTAGHNGPIIEPEAFGPYFFNTDLSLFKTFKFRESKNLEFRAEGFNFLNHANYTFGSDNNLNLTFNAVGQQTNALFGTATSKIGHRIMQLAVKFYF
jgi:hypothetical protein